MELTTKTLGNVTESKMSRV